MVMCIVKGCESKSKWYSTVMFHRIPTKRKDRMYRWLAALNIDLNTPIESIKKWRVCSEHFVPDDYQEYTNSISPGQRLKDTAIPNYNTRGSSSSAVQSCEPCQRKSPVTTQRQIPGFPKLKEPWEVLVLDLIGPLPATLRNNNYALVMTDLYTKWVVAEPIQTKTVAEVSAVITAKFYQFGAAREILTDLGQQFVNELNSSLYAALKLKDVVSCAHHPQNAEQILSRKESAKSSRRKRKVLKPRSTNPEDVSGSEDPEKRLRGNTCQDKEVNTDSRISFKGVAAADDELRSQRTGYNEMEDQLTEWTPGADQSSTASQWQNEHSYAYSPSRCETSEVPLPGELERLPTIVRDLHTAFYWLQNNRNLLRGDVTEPAFLGMNIDCQQNAIRKLSGEALSDEPDPFLFIFQFHDDMDKFLAWCIDEQGLEVRAMVLKEEVKHLRWAHIRPHLFQLEAVGHHEFPKHRRHLTSQKKKIPVRDEDERKAPVTTQRQIPGFPKVLRWLSVVQAFVQRFTDPKEPWEVLVLDLIGPLPATLRNNNYALVMTDLYTKWVVAEPIQTKTVAEVSAVITAKFYQFGAAREILTDLGQQFVNELNSSLYAALKLKDVVSCAHHPQNAEQDANQTIKHALCTCVSDNHFDWDLQLPAVQFSKKEKTKGSHQIRRQDEKVNTESSAPLNGTEGPASQRTAYVMEKPDMALQCQNEHSYACSPRRYGTIKERLPTIVRDLHTAFYWLQNNRNLLRGDVTEPAFLGMNIDCQQDAIRKLSGDALSDEPDPFLFIFQFQDDMDNFLAWCIDEQGLEVRAMVLKEEEETESVG
ncbi:hypothetical protein DNTS_006153 [Danionella cerebrum]|uniref:Integrase catalytic domain-containing protein n=1 Tax=Danionella cerebrum TaxID=2873325 RepID=A0A553RHK4_9TELE|nr:hypothetical protein DNTS_006153 [Danionella translucida]